MAQLSVWTRLWRMACLLWRLPALPSFGMSWGETSLTCEAFYQTRRRWEQELVENEKSKEKQNAAFDRTDGRQREGYDLCREWTESIYVGEACGSIGDGEVDGRVVGVGDGAFEPSSRDWLTESGLLDRIGSFQHLQCGFHQRLMLLRRTHFLRRFSLLFYLVCQNRNQRPRLVLCMSYFTPIKVDPHSFIEHKINNRGSYWIKYTWAVISCEININNLCIIYVTSLWVNNVSLKRVEWE